MKDGDFFLDENAVGHFVDPQAATTDGRHRYEPYRGTGHMELSRALERGERPRCWRRQGSRRAWFTVTSEDFIEKTPKCEWWLTLEDVETAKHEERRLSSDQLAALIVDALADARIIARPKIPAAIAIAAEEIEVRKAMGDY